jgi:hypothetical protein
MMLAARLALSSTVLAAALALSFGGSAPATFDASAPSDRFAGSIDHPRFVGRLLDVDGEPFVGQITLNCRIDFPESAAMPYEVNSRTDASGAFDVTVGTPRRFSRPTNFAWILAPQNSRLYGDFALASHEARRAAGTLAFESGDDGAVIGDIGAVQLVEAPRVGSLRIDGPVATTHAVAVHEDRFKNSPMVGPFENPFEVFDVETGSTVELFSWSTTDRWHVFTKPASPRAEALQAVIERGQDLVLISRELLNVCVTIDPPPPDRDGRTTALVVQPVTTAVTARALFVDPASNIDLAWITHLELPSRDGTHRFVIDRSRRDLELHLPAGIYRFEYWQREHLFDGPLLATTAAVAVDRFVDLRARR